MTSNRWRERATTLRARALDRAPAGNRRARAIIAACGVVPVLALPSAAGAVTLIGSGSSAAQPYMLELFKGYHQLHPKVVFKYIPDGGNAGVKDVQAGKSEFAVNTRPPLPSDSGTTYVKLFLDALCIAVNPQNTLSDVSTSDLKNVFLGVDTSWNQVSGSNLPSTIDPIGRNPSAGQYTFFQQSVLGNQLQSSNVLQEPSDGLVQVKVSQDANAIGYLGLAHSGSGVRKLAVNGVPCDAAHIRTESYPLFRYDWAVLPTSRPNGAVDAFFNWVRSSKAAGRIINRAGAVAKFNA